MKALFDEAEVRKTLAKIIKHGAVFEVRALDAKLSTHHRAGTVSGYFNNPDACISELGNLTNAKGIYVTLNPVNPALLARRANRLACAEKDATTSDQHILQRRWLPVDVDFDRPSGISASHVEKQEAHKKALETYDFLKTRGCSLPLVADSGNGFHLLYPVDLPAQDGGLLEKVLIALANRFDCDGVKLDRSVHNPARIVRLYGMLAAKGDNTQERPHRLSKILKSPLRVALTAEQLRALLQELHPEEPAQPEQRAIRSGVFDVAGFLARYGVDVKEKIIELDGTIKWLLKHCPFNHDHVDGEAAVFQRPDGTPGVSLFSQQLRR